MPFLTASFPWPVRKGIAVNAKAKVPDRMRISDVNLCAMLGNLLDNAIEACLRIEGRKKVHRVYIGSYEAAVIYFRNQLYGEKRPEKTGGRFCPRKADGMKWPVLASGSCGLMS